LPGIFQAQHVDCVGVEAADESGVGQQDVSFGIIAASAVGVPQQADFPGTEISVLMP